MGQLECRLDSAHDLAALLAAMQLRDQKDQRVHCEASARGIKLVAQSAGKDAAVMGWMLNTSFRDYKYTGEAEEMHLRLPIAPLLSCLQIFSERAGLLMQYPSGDSADLYLTMEEDGAVTECRLHTLMLDEAPTTFNSFFAPREPTSELRLAQPEAWYHALNEFSDMDSPDVALRVKLCPAGPFSAEAPAVVLRAQTVTADAEVELPRGVFEHYKLADEVPATGVTYSYPLQSMLASCLRAARDAKAVKVRFNNEGVMSTQFILRGRGQLFCEALVSPLADVVGGASVTGSAFAPAAAAVAAGSVPSMPSPGLYAGSTFMMGGAATQQSSLGFREELIARNL